MAQMPPTPPQFKDLLHSELWDDEIFYTDLFKK